MNRVTWFLFSLVWVTLQACGDSANPPVDAGSDGQIIDSGPIGDNDEFSTADANDSNDTSDSKDAFTEEDAGNPDDADDSSGVDDADVDAGIENDGDAPTDNMDGGSDSGEADSSDAIGDRGGDSGPLTFVAVTFNTGIHPNVGSNGFSSEQSQYLDEYYGNGLSWNPAIDEARDFLDIVQPDVVVFQEIFDMEQCQDIPTEARQGFVCETWSPGSHTVAELVLGSAYQIACNWQKHDKCAAVKRQFATFSGCSDDYCPDGLFGSTISDCGSGARIGRVVLNLAQGGTITLVNVHGSSGISGDDRSCRVKQVEQVFMDLGDGAPAANGDRNLVLGDFNTDPRSAAAVAIDASARRWNDFVGSSHSFHFINEYVKTYKNLFCIDNVLSDELEGTCWYPGFTSGHPTVSPEQYFDHTPTVCTITLP